MAIMVVLSPTLRPGRLTQRARSVLCGQESLIAKKYRSADRIGACGLELSAYVTILRLLHTFKNFGNSPPCAIGEITWQRGN
jgi:hypothetical protein